MIFEPRLVWSPTRALVELMRFPWWYTAHNWMRDAHGARVRVSDSAEFESGAIRPWQLLAAAREIYGKQALGILGAIQAHHMIHNHILGGMQTAYLASWRGARANRS